MTPSRKFRRRRGIMLFEVLVLVILFAAFSAVAVQLLHNVLHLSHQSGKAAALPARFDGALGQLRRDVWGATRVEVTDPQLVRIDHADAPQITWSVTDQGALLRTAGTEKQDWPDIAAGMTFEFSGAVLTLIEPPGHGEKLRRIPLTSRLIAGDGGAK